MILKLIPVILMMFYFWAILGLDIFNINTYSYRQNSPYESYDYAEFTSFGKALLVLF